MSTRRLRAPEPDPGRWRTLPAGKLQAGDRLASHGAGQLDSVRVMSPNQVFLENRLGEIFVLDAAEMVTAWVPNR